MGKDPRTMLPILSNAQIRQVDQTTMAREPISALDLMERAAGRCATKILTLLAAGSFDPFKRVLAIVGMGNNGGDGLVIARLLHSAGVPVRVIRVLHRSVASPEHQANHARAIDNGLEVIDMDHLSPAIQPFDNELIIDCLFGSGLTRAPEDWVRAVIIQMDRSGCPIVSIDVPSGLIEPTVAGLFDPASCVRAAYTLVLELPRMALLLPETGPFAGVWHVIPIGLDSEAMAAEEPVARWVERSDIQGLLKPLPRFAHKGTFGHAALIAGSSGMLGAAVLATQACLKSGVGLVTSHIPTSLAVHLAVVAPDAMTAPQTPEQDAASPFGSGKYSAIGMGPGLGRSLEAKELVDNVLHKAVVPIVLDADALNLLAGYPSWFQGMEGRLILTPHPREMDRLLGDQPRTSYERLMRTREFAMRYQCTVILKGAYTAVCSSAGQIHFNSTGNCGMAKGGSGDALTGLLTGLLAQGYSVEQASLIAVYLHGLAGDLAASELGHDAMRPTDLIDFLPNAWVQLRS